MKNPVVAENLVAQANENVKKVESFPALLEACRLAREALGVRIYSAPRDAMRMEEKALEALENILDELG